MWQVRFISIATGRLSHGEGLPAPGPRPAAKTRRCSVRSCIRSVGLGFGCGSGPHDTATAGWCARCTRIGDADVCPPTGDRSRFDKGDAPTTDRNSEKCRLMLLFFSILSTQVHMQNSNYQANMPTFLSSPTSSENLQNNHYNNNFIKIISSTTIFLVLSLPS